MKCPNCRNKVDINDDNCPKCNASLSFTTKLSNEDKKQSKIVLNETNKLKKIVFLCIFIAIIIVGIFIFLFNNNVNMMYFNLFIKRFLMLMNASIIIGVIGIILCLILNFFKNNIRISKIFFVIGLVLIIVPMFVKLLVHIKADISLTDYSKDAYIDLCSLKIPTINSVVGKRSIFFSDEKENYYDSDSNSTMDYIVIIYHKLSTKDIMDYKNELINSGFIVEEMEDDENESTYIFLKNNESLNVFCAVSIDENANSILYSKQDGTYQEFLDRINKKSYN